MKNILAVCYCHLSVARNECIISTSPNVETPCQNGYCVDSIGDYFCVCFDGFQGRNCDEMGKQKR